MSVRKRYGVPEATTQGNVGDLYVDLNTGKVYRCEDIVTDGDEHSYGTVYTNRGNKNTVYVWKSTGASSYNELEDKPFYEETVVTPVTEFEFELEATDTDNPYKWFRHEDLPFELDGLLAVLNSENVGKTVCVNYDGVQYMCDVHMDNRYSWYIGNSGLMKNFDRMSNDDDSILDRMKDDGLIIDTGEPFLFLSHSYYTVYNYIVASDTNPHNVEVGFCDTVVHKLDKKFLPDDIGGSGGGAEIIEATVNTSRTDILDLPITTREIFDKVKSGVDVVIKTTFTKSSEPFTAFFRLTYITNDGVYLIAQLPALTASGVKEDRCILYIYAGQAMTTAEYRFAT